MAATVVAQPPHLTPARASRRAGAPQRLVKGSVQHLYSTQQFPRCCGLGSSFGLRQRHIAPGPGIQCGYFSCIADKKAQQRRRLAGAPSRQAKKPHIGSTCSCAPVGEQQNCPAPRGITHAAVTSSVASAAAAVVLAAAILLGAPVAHAAKGPSGAELFEPMSYAGRWYEVASLKQGFAGEGQQDCHCTQGIYEPIQNPSGTIQLQVSTFCVHGSPTGRISGIKGEVTCANPTLLQLVPEFETPAERREGIQEKCVLRFPSIPFVPPQPYDVIRTDYKSYALVKGAPDTSFVQIYSRTPNPGQEFIEQRKAELKELGYPAELIKDTPQDCPEVPQQQLMSMMGSRDMVNTMTNTLGEGVALPGLGQKGIALAQPANPLQTLKDLFDFVKAEKRASE